MTDAVVKIHQRVQERGKFLFMTADEGIALVAPIFLGVLARHPFFGFIAGIVLWRLWVVLKGEGGLAHLMAAAYWWLPSEVPFYKAFPASHVSEWQG